MARCTCRSSHFIHAVVTCSVIVVYLSCIGLLLNGPLCEETCLWVLRATKRADQPTHPRNLIRAFFIHLLKSSLPKLATSENWIFWPVSVAEQVGLGMLWSKPTTSDRRAFTRVKSRKFGYQVNSDTHLQTVEIQMRRLLMSRVIRIFTVCFVNLFFIPITELWNKHGGCPNLAVCPNIPDFTLYCAVSVDCVKCGGILTAESGQLNSPEVNNNGTSPISIRCHWTIMSENRTIELQILHMNLDFYTDNWCPHTSLKVNCRH